MSPAPQNFRTRRGWAIAAALFIAACSSDAAFANDPNPVPKVPKDDPAMNAAFARAAAGLDGFFAQWRHPPPGAEGFAVKIGLSDAPGKPGYALVRPGAGSASAVEYFWVGDLHVEDAGFSGQLSNEPEDLQNVAFGQVIHFTREDISDWMYLQNGKIVGNATACPALAHASAEERREMKDQYGLACD